MSSGGTTLRFTAFVGIGSNLGDRRRNIERGIDLLDATAGVRVLGVSDLIETEPVGGPPGQPRFLNAACRAATGLTPRKLLARLLEIEDECGRIRQERWGPRTLDLDLLLFDDMRINEPDLVVPHPRMHERSFVLRPLAQVAPDAVHPVLGATVLELLERLSSVE